MQNVQLLRWCKELGIQVTWNMIAGIPGEDPVAYQRMHARMERLYHLTPPSGVAEFQLHRFSPFFENSRDFGIQRTGALPIYRKIFPVDRSDADDLAYQHDFKLERPVPLESYVAPVREVITNWTRRSTDDASLELLFHDDGTATLTDMRYETEVHHHLSRAETELYAYLDQARTIEGISKHLESNVEGRSINLNSRAAVEDQLQAWDQAKIVLNDGRRWSALATFANRPSEHQHLREELKLPVAYLN